MIDTFCSRLSFPKNFLSFFWAAAATQVEYPIFALLTEFHAYPTFEDCVKSDILCILTFEGPILDIRNVFNKKQITRYEVDRVNASHFSYQFHTNLFHRATSMITVCFQVDKEQDLKEMEEWLRNNVR